MNMMYRITIPSLVGALALVVSCSDEKNTDDGVQTRIDEATDAIDKYKDIAVALSDGYLNTLEFVESPEGGMGIHLFNPAITEIDHEAPSVLLYGVGEDGTYELLGAEWIVPSEGLDEAPELFGEVFAGPLPGHEPGEPEHYALHAWLVVDNPDGMFADFNPEVSAPSFWGDMGLMYGAMGPMATPDGALAAGYVDTGECVADPGGSGAMGVHWVNASITEIDASTPNVLMFGDLGAGMELMGVEWVVPTDVVTEPPVLFGQTFEGPIPPHADGEPETYALHLWSHTTNPIGMFADFNPTLSCD